MRPQRAQGDVSLLRDDSQLGVYAHSTHCFPAAASDPLAASAAASEVSWRFACMTGRQALISFDPKLRWSVMFIKATWAWRAPGVAQRSAMAQGECIGGGPAARHVGLPADRDVCISFLEQWYR
jgi:hypothetical protein